MPPLDDTLPLATLTPPSGAADEQLPMATLTPPGAGGDQLPMATLTPPPGVIQPDKNQGQRGVNPPQ